MRVVGCAPVPNAPVTGSMTISAQPVLAGRVGGRAHAQPPGDLPRVAGAAPPLLGAVATSSSSRASSASPASASSAGPSGSSP